MSRFPDPPSPVPPSSLEDCDAALERLTAGARKWVALRPKERAALLRRCADGMVAVSDRWAALSCKAKGLQRDSAGEGEEWLAGVLPVVRNLRLFAEGLDAGGQPRLPSTWQRPDGQWVARVFPQNLMDKALFAGVTADIWIEPGRTPSTGKLYRNKAAGLGDAGGICVVLGAGNQSSIGPMDVLYKLVVDDEVCILKMNPVNEYLGGLIVEAFAPLVQGGFLEVVYGGAKCGGHLCNHASTHSIHMTGSSFTHDAIVWGVGDEGAANKAAGTPKLDKVVTSELGCVTPTLVVPGDWSDADLEYQARQVAAMVTYNAGFNCNAAKALVVAKDWALKDRFLDKLRARLSAHPARKSYYPTGQKLYDDFTGRYPEHDALGERTDEQLPWTILLGVGTGEDEYALRNEAWCGLIALIELDAAGAGAFIPQAVAFANDRCWGTLSCNVLIDKATQKAHAAAFEQAIADLRYGGIGINCWTGLNYGLVNATWGAFPGHPLDDIQSGQGVVHNGLLVDYPQKSVVQAPFRMQPTPAWFTDHKNGVALGRKMTAFELSPSWLKVPGVAGAALKG